jgi:alcohol dehydrogenase (cytochrome c)
VLYKIDGDPDQEKLPLANRGAALWGNLVVTVARYPPRVVATDKETGKVTWKTNLSDGQTDLPATGKLIWRRYVIPALLFA